MIGCFFLGTIAFFYASGAWALGQDSAPAKSISKSDEKSESRVLTFLKWIDDQKIVYGSKTTMNCRDLETDELVWNRTFEEPIKSATINSSCITLVNFNGIEQINLRNGITQRKISSKSMSDIQMLPIAAITTAKNEIVAVNFSEEFGESGIVIDAASCAIIKVFRTDSSLWTNSRKWSFSEDRYIARTHSDFVSVRDIANDTDVYISKTRNEIDPSSALVGWNLFETPYYSSKKNILVYSFRENLRRFGSVAKVVIIDTNSKQSKTIVVGSGTATIEVDFSSELIGTAIHTGEVRMLGFQGNLIGYGTFENHDGRKLYASLAPGGQSMVVGGNIAKLSVFKLEAGNLIENKLAEKITQK